jgi:hypothetical protein
MFMHDKKNTRKLIIYEFLHSIMKFIDMGMTMAEADETKNRN